ncbi:uncharacterized protein SCHCODRAFT_01033891 [Schizophyllum commune H4-8]|uniref:Uncharacterized protein n=1 Tax=Schizophyllum commune (strain H4-8 / FGSC 9210) TaxID=578458 RepID=D8Q8U7_SCHCM|nr:uncharacterized protein SCHCODRAFT_01033891 [Schizophyllum commune H4-8]KAI5890666.1 hypothetical protein SCHCODRAFT_01033891 [Schizophyllum commune H4-8]
MLLAKQLSRPILVFCDSTAPKQLRESCNVLALFVKSDLLCSVLPAVLLTAGISGCSSVLKLLNGLIWVTLHVLVCVIIGVEEDRLVKPDRPIASGRITLDNAIHLHRGIVVVLLFFSARRHTLPLSTVYVLGTTVYNDGHLSRFWALKSIMTGFGIMMCSWGAAVCFACEIGHPSTMLMPHRFMPKISVTESGISKLDAEHSLSYYRPESPDGPWVL